MAISRESFDAVQYSIGLDFLEDNKLADVIFFIYDLLNGNIDCSYLLEHNIV